jgi:hypothetical protein
MTWDRMELPIDLGIEKSKIEDRINEKDNRVTNSYWSMYDSLCITADMDNAQPVLVSDYPEEKQVNNWSSVDYIELQPSWEIHLPWNREIQALNRPYVMWASGDVIKVVAR